MQVIEGDRFLPVLPTLCEQWQYLPILYVCRQLDIKHESVLLPFYVCVPGDIHCLCLVASVCIFHRRLCAHTYLCTHILMHSNDRDKIDIAQFYQNYEKYCISIFLEFIY